MAEGGSEESEGRLSPQMEVTAFINQKEMYL